VRGHDEEEAPVPFRPVPGRYRIRFTGHPFYDPQGFWIGYATWWSPRPRPFASSTSLPSESHSCSVPWRAARALTALRGRRRARRLPAATAQAWPGLNGYMVYGSNRTGTQFSDDITSRRWTPRRPRSDVPPRRRRAAGVIGRRATARVQDRAVRQQPACGHQRRRLRRDAADANVPLQRRAARMVARRHEAAHPTGEPARAERRHLGADVANSADAAGHPARAVADR
jgi:hypothetical protein